MGRKARVSYTQKIGDYIADQLSSAFDVTIKDILQDETGKQREDMPSESIIYRWLKKYPDFKEKYDEARKIQAHAGNDFILQENRRLLDARYMKMPEVSALCSYIKTLQYIEEKKFWRYDRELEDRVAALEERIKTNAP